MPRNDLHQLLGHAESSEGLHTRGGSSNNQYIIQIICCRSWAHSAHIRAPIAAMSPGRRGYRRFTVQLKLSSASILPRTSDGSIATANDTYTVHMVGHGRRWLDDAFLLGKLGFNFIGGNDPWAGFEQIAAPHNDLLLTRRSTGVPSSTIKRPMPTWAAWAAGTRSARASHTVGLCQ